jgi:two-component system sensor histidine kinase TctE
MTADRGLDRRRHPSMRTRLLGMLTGSMLVILSVFGTALYLLARHFDRDEHDRAIRQDIGTVIRLLQAEPMIQTALPATQKLLSYDSDGQAFFAIDSRRLGNLSGDPRLPLPERLPAVGAGPQLYDAAIEGTAVRAAVARIVPGYAADDVLTVVWAESLEGEQRRARSLLADIVLLTTSLAAAILALAWLGVNAGLRQIEPLTARIASRQSDLGPVTRDDVPREILPLSRTIDALFARLQSALTAQERFLADAAHQLRTPLAGIQLNADHALQEMDPAASREALSQIRELATRAGRLAGQLVALSRVDSPVAAAPQATAIDLAAVTREVVAARIGDASRAGVDLGYRGPEAGPRIVADKLLLYEALDNLVDNALRYAGSGATVTACVDDRPGNCGAWIEDNGPGVAEVDLPRLGDRFFRPADSRPGGSGLGLAIVRGIASQLGAEFQVARLAERGLRAGLLFP